MPRQARKPTAAERNRRTQERIRKQEVQAPPASGGGGGTIFAGGSIALTANQDNPASAGATIIWDTLLYDTGGFVDLGTDATVITIPESGWYQAALALYNNIWANDETIECGFQAELTKNATGAYRTWRWVPHRERGSGPTDPGDHWGHLDFFGATEPVQCSAGDTYTLLVTPWTQTTGFSYGTDWGITLEGSADPEKSCRMSVWRVG